MSEKVYLFIESEPKPLYVVGKVKYSNLITGFQKKKTFPEGLFYLQFPIHSPGITTILKAIIIDQNYLQT